MAVKLISVLIATDIGNDEIVGFVRTLVAYSALANVYRCRLGAISWIIPVVQGSGYFSFIYRHFRLWY